MNALPDGSRAWRRRLLGGAGAALLAGTASAQPLAQQLAMTQNAGAGQETAGAVPALYTAAQAATGADKFAANCALCHGKKLQGRVGPALTGPNFASAKANFKVSDVFLFLSRQMPAQQPGSLPKQDYVDIMAFLLQQNGYPAGGVPLTEAAAASSTVPLLYHGK